MEENSALITVIRNLELGKSAKSSNDEQFQILTEFIDDLIRNDFNRLLNLLYRIDISEEKLKQTLTSNKEEQIPSAELIAKLIIAREEEKIISRAKYRSK